MSKLKKEIEKYYKDGFKKGYNKGMVRALWEIENNGVGSFIALMETLDINE